MQGSFFESAVAPPSRAGDYGVLYLDDPWPEKGGGQIKRGADGHYDVMTVKQIEAMPFGDWAAPDSHCYMWATNRYLEDAFRIMRMRRFRYLTMVTWVKDRMGLGQYFRGMTEHCLFGVRGRMPYRTRPDGKRAQGRTVIYAPDASLIDHDYPGDRNPDDYCGDCGASARMRCFDDCARRVEPEPDLPTAFEAPVPRASDGKRIHSRKPKKMREYIELVSGDVPRLECYARIATPGFDVWGNQAPA